MSTQTSRREKMFVNLPEHLTTLVEKEVALMGLSTASFIRILIKSHRGDAPSRAPDAPIRKLPAKLRAKAASRAAKQVLLDPEDIAYLDAIGLVGGLSRNAVVVLLLLDWFDIPYLKPARLRH